MNERGKKVVVEILGHKAQIESVSARIAQEPWWRKDMILVGLSFDEPVGSTAGFAIILPVRSYTRYDFLASVRREGEKRLKIEIESDRLRRDEQTLEKERKDTLNQKMEEIKALIGLD